MGINMNLAENSKKNDASYLLVQYLGEKRF